MPRVEVITRGERRRRWSVEEKREIVLESLQADIGPGEAIRKHGISSGQLYTWRQQLTRRLGVGLTGPEANFARVDVAVAQRHEKAALVAGAAAAATAPDLALPVHGPPRVEGLIEIMLPHEPRLRRSRGFAIGENEAGL